MATPPISDAERTRRQDLIHQLLEEGFAPLGVCGGRGSAIGEASARLGLSTGTLTNAIRSGKLIIDWTRYKPPSPAVRAETASAARQGWAPSYDLRHELPEGLTVKGTSVFYDAEGHVEKYWNKSKQQGRLPEETVQLSDPKKITKVSSLYDHEGRIVQQWVAERPEDSAREKAWRDFAEQLTAELPRVEPITPPESGFADLLVTYLIGDHHTGMLSWAKETGADYDLEIAERLLSGATEHLMAAAPASDQGVLAVLGDFLHYDSPHPVTPKNGNFLDSDSRFEKMVDVAIRSLRRSIAAGLRRHRKLHVIVEGGNHDPFSGAFLRQCLKNIYENEPRLTVDTSPSRYHYFEFGKVLIGTHHGDGAKMAELPLIMATDRPESWGRTAYRYWYTGHVHHDSAKDYPGVRVESVRILAPVDAWAHGEGYRSMRDMKAVTLHREHGEVSRLTVNPNMLRGSM